MICLKPTFAYTRLLTSEPLHCVVLGVVASWWIELFAIYSPTTSRDVQATRKTWLQKHH